MGTDSAPAAWPWLRWGLPALALLVGVVVLGRATGWSGLGLGPLRETLLGDKTETQEQSPPLEQPEAQEQLGDEIPDSAPATAASSPTVESLRPTPENFNPDSSGAAATSSLGPSTDSSYPLFVRSISPMTADAARSATEMAQAAVEQGRFADALIWLNQVPFNQQTTDYQAVYAQVERQLYDQTLRNQALLATAQAQSAVEQVAGLNQAIFQAQQIRPGEAGYRQAQDRIYQWSEQILAFAIAEAEAGNLGAAIAVVDFVPRSQPGLQVKAQAAAMDWQGRLAYRQIIDKARQSLRPGQVESFHQAIIQVQSIPDGNPEFDRAQQLIQQWSEQILAIARDQAAQGQIQAAITSAQLILPDAAIAAEARALIQQWQQQ